MSLRWNLKFRTSNIVVLLMSNKDHVHSMNITLIMCEMSQEVLSILHEVDLIVNLMILTFDL